jgi:hypothetical protein
MGTWSNDFFCCTFFFFFFFFNEDLNYFVRILFRRNFSIKIFNIKNV